MRFFADRNVSPRLINMLAAYSVGDHEVKHHDQDARFDKMTPDETWLSTLGEDRPKWVILSADLAILDRPPERKALREANLTFFGFDRSWAKLAFPEQAWKIVKIWPAIIDRAESKLERPTVFKVHWGSGLKIEELYETRPFRRDHR